MYKVESKSWNISIEDNGQSEKDVCFSIFLYVVITNLNALSAVLIQLPKGGGKLISGDSLHDPYPAVLEQQEASQLGFTLGKRK
jgi:hypothetical protein